MAGTIDSFRAWRKEVKEVRSFLDESYTVSIKNKLRGKGRLSWGRTIVEKFYARVIPQLTGDREIRALEPKIRRACFDAIAFGSSTIVVFEDGSVAVSDPNQSYARRSTFGDVTWEQWSKDKDSLGSLSLGDLTHFSINGDLVTKSGEGDDAIFVPSGRTFTIFSRRGESGESRITPAIRAEIKAQARTDLRMEESENFYTWPQRIINGVWDGFNEESGGDLQAVIAGYNQILAIPTDPLNGGKASIEEWSSGDFSKYATLNDLRIKRTAAAGNIEPQELGFTQSQFSSAEAIYSSKEDLVLEINEFTSGCTLTIEDLIEYVSEIHGLESTADFSWANPATPSLGSRTDAFVKISSAIPAIKYSKPAILEFGILSPETVDSLFEEQDMEELIRLSLENEQKALEQEVTEENGE